MKRLALILPFLLFTGSYGATISDSITVWKWVQPDTYNISITVRARGNSEEEVLEALRTADDYLRRTGLNYTGGNFSLWPVREWNPKEKRYVELGFSGSSTYTFHLKSPKEQGEIFRALEEARRVAGFKYSVNSARWEVSWERRERALEELKGKALEGALKEGESFGKILKERCILKEISFSPNTPPPFPVLKGVKAMGVSAPEPKRSSERVELRASFKLECGKVLK